MQKLIDLSVDSIERGDVFRFPAKYPYEDFVDFMVILTSDPERPIGIMVSTGYSAGHVLVHLPPESILPGTRMLSTDWVKKNWMEWIYASCPMEDVFFLGKYPAPKGA